MRIVCVIPARLGASRLPDKPLQLLLEEPLIAHVARRVVGWDFVDRTVVAADDRRVVEAVSHLPVEGVLTPSALESGTARVAHVMRTEPHREDTVVLNVQGDEPFLPVAAALGAVAAVRAGAGIGTAAAPLEPGDGDDSNVVKVRVRDGRATAFARTMPGGDGAGVFRHLGVYAFGPGVLTQWMDAPPVPEEIEHRLEQLRPLALGIPIGVATIETPAPPAVDTAADLARATAYLHRLVDEVRA